MSNAPRKIIQITATSPCPDTETSGVCHGEVIALCDDGTVWATLDDKERWWRLPPIPQGDEP